MSFSIYLENNAGKFSIEEIAEKIIIHIRYSGPIDDSFGNNWGGHYGCIIEGNRIIKEDLPSSTDLNKLLIIINEIIPTLDNPYKEILRKAYSARILRTFPINEHFKEVLRIKE